MIDKLNWIASEYEMTGDQLFFIVSNIWPIGSPEFNFKLKVNNDLQEE